VFRKLPPAHDERNPYWAYLVAPLDGRDGTPTGQILRFAADRVKLLPKGAADGGQQQPWTVPVDHGTLVKLYDFINGQLHAGWHSRFFRRKGIDPSLVADDLLVVVDCSKLSDEGIRQLFTGGRDRMIDDSPLRSWTDDLAGQVADDLKCTRRRSTTAGFAAMVPHPGR